jgi:hypothetical protein
MPEIYYLERGVLSAQECSELVEHIAQTAQDDHRPGYQHSGILIYDILAGEVPAPVAPIRKAIKIANSIFNENYEFRYNRFELKRLFGNIMHKGALNEPHDDDGDVYPEKPAVEEHYSCVLMLNSDYQGGELYFEHHGVEVRLEAGDLIMFRGNAENLHGVRQVTDGTRTNVIIFFRNFELDAPYDEDIWLDFIAEQ